MQASEARQVREALQEAQHLIDTALALIDGDAAPGDLVLPEGFCKHGNKQPGMGGYWTCLDCGLRGRAL
jgi:hypothetical protein